MMKSPKIFQAVLLLTLLFSFSAYGQSASQTRDVKPADLVVYAQAVRTCDLSMTEAQAIAIADGRYVYVGDQSGAQEWIGSKTQVVKLPTSTLTPGFCDSHLHFLGLGEALQNLDLNDCQSWAEVIELVKDAARIQPEGTWIVGRGWHQSKWKDLPAESVEGYPVHNLMSEATQKHPVVLTHASGHALFANKLAMDIAGVTADTSDPAGGEILRNSLGEPVGVFRENAQGLIRRAQQRSSQKLNEQARLDQVLQQIELAGQECLRHGITSVHDAGSSFITAERFRQFASEGKLPVRVTMMIRTSANELRRKMPSHRWIELEDSRFTVRSVKISADGALGPHGAWLLAPYSDLVNKVGLNTVPMDTVREIAQLCKEQQWQLCVHAIGDRANQEVLDIYEEVLGDEVKSDHRWRIEHAQHLAESDISRFGQMGVIPAMQANHCTSDAIFVPTRLGERRSATGAYVWRSLIDSGAIIPNGTDAPVERVDPRASLFASVTRQLKNGAAFYPEQCMTREEMLWSYTLWPAKAAFHEEQVGSIEVGKFADFVAWDRDLLSCKAEDLLTAEVQQVWLQGATVFKPGE